MYCQLCIQWSTTNCS